MNSQQLYLNIHQALSIDTNIEDYQAPTADDYSREIDVHVARNSQGNNISHITAEFKGLRAKFFLCSMFDGSGPYGASINTFAMPKMKLSQLQKGLIALSFFEFLITSGKLINADFDYYKEKFSGELNGGATSVLRAYEVINARSDRILAGRGVL